MSLSNKKKTQSTSDIFDDDFEVIYEGDLPDISIDDDDDYRDVLSGLSDIDHTDYIKKNDYDRLTKKLKNKKYYVKARAYTKVGKKSVYGSWSEVKTIKKVKAKKAKTKKSKKK